MYWVLSTLPTASGSFVVQRLRDAFLRAEWKLTRNAAKMVGVNYATFAPQRLATKVFAACFGKGEYAFSIFSNHFWRYTAGQGSGSCCRVAQAEAFVGVRPLLVYEYASLQKAMYQQYIFT